MNYVALLLKYWPVILAAFQAIAKMVQAIESLLKKQKEGSVDIIDENQKIDEATSKLVRIGYQFLPQEARDNAKEEEIKAFVNDLWTVALTIRKAAESFHQLLV